MSKSATSLEQQLATVEAAVVALESGDLPLEDALKRYETALHSLRQARKLLDGYAARLEELRADAPANG